MRFIIDGKNKSCYTVGLLEEDDGVYIVIDGEEILCINNNGYIELIYLDNKPPVGLETEKYQNDNYVVIYYPDDEE